MSATGRGTERNANDHYKTPAWCIEMIMEGLNTFRPGGISRVQSVLDPCVGTGSIPSVVTNYIGQRENGDDYSIGRHMLYGIDIDETRADTGGKAVGKFQHGDFLTMDMPEGWPKFDLVISNPPFRVPSGDRPGRPGRDGPRQFIDRALQVTSDKGLICFLTRVGWMVGGKHRDAWRRKLVSTYKVHAFGHTKRPSFTGRGTDASEYVWLLIDKDPDALFRMDHNHNIALSNL